MIFIINIMCQSISARMSPPFKYVFVFVVKYVCQILSSDVCDIISTYDTITISSSRH